MQNRFLLHRIGFLLIIIGLAILLGILRYDQTDRFREASAPGQNAHTLVIDAGHGGDDGGAVAADGTQEAELNLQISKRLQLLSALSGATTVMTRDSAEVRYPDTAKTIASRKVADQKQRVSLIRSIPNAVLISVHQNQFPTAQPHGAQVLYAATEGSRPLGEQIQQALVTTLDPENRRLADLISDEIYLTAQIACPAVLIECGFISNPAECQRLQTQEYQIKLAMTILSSYLQYEQNGSLI